jgi:hypothetical protein
LVLLSLKFMQRRTERWLLGSQIRERYGSNGSAAAVARSTANGRK